MATFENWFLFCPTHPVVAGGFFRKWKELFHCRGVTAISDSKIVQSYESHMSRCQDTLIKLERSVQLPDKEPPFQSPAFGRGILTSRWLLTRISWFFWEMARIGFLCFLFLLLALLLIIHIGVINEDFLLPVAISKEIRDGERHTNEAVSPCFDPPLSDNSIFSLASVASQNPASPPNASCTSASTTPRPPASPCKDPAFTGQLLPKRRRIIHVILFGFEVTIPLSN